MSVPAQRSCYTLNYDVPVSIDAMADSLWIELDTKMEYDIRRDIQFPLYPIVKWNVIYNNMCRFPL